MFRKKDGPPEQIVDDHLNPFDFARIRRTLDDYGTLLDNADRLHSMFIYSNQTYTGDEVAAILRKELLGMKS